MRDNPGAPLGRWLRALAPVLTLAAAVLFFYAIPPHPPLTLFDLRLVAVHAMIVGTAAIGMTFVIISAGIDLSVGSAIALVSVAAALVLEDGGGVGAALIVALSVGALCGLYNGLLVTSLRLPPFIATLGTLGFYRGVAKWISGSIPVTAPTRGLDVWVNPIPDPPWLLVAPGVWLMISLGIGFLLLLRYSVLGQHALAIGSNEATARLCGIRVARTKVVIYGLAGLLTGLARRLQFAPHTHADDRPRARHYCCSGDRWWLTSRWSGFDCRDVGGCRADGLSPKPQHGTGLAELCGGDDHRPHNHCSRRGRSMARRSIALIT